MDGQTVSALRAVTGISVSCMISPIERGMERERERGREGEGVEEEDSEGSGKGSEKQDHGSRW